MSSGDAPTIDASAEGAIASAPLDGGVLLGGVYEIRALLGRGGMGTVYEAYDRMLNRVVAVKVAHHGESQFPLRNEGQALAALNHRAIPTVYAMGLHQGRDYLVMERVG